MEIAPDDGRLIRIRKRRRTAGFMRDAKGPLIVAAGVAVAEQLLSVWPSFPEPANLVLIATALVGFLTNINSAVLSSLIAVTYGLVFVPERHSMHGTSFEICLEGIFLSCAAPFLAILGGILKQNSDKASEALKKHLSNTPLGVIELREDYEVTLWAGSAQSIFGIDPETAVGKSLFELPHIFFKPEDAKKLHELLFELEEGSRVRAVHHARIESQDGGPGHSRWFFSTTLDARSSRSRFLVLVEDITDRVRAEQELEASRTELIQRLVRAAELRDTDTGAHIVRMAQYCVELAKAIGLDEETCSMLLAAAPMHDIGKLGVPDSILLKEGPLTPEERAIMQQHTLIGANVLQGSSSELIRMAEQIALTHHERWDGTGYPHGLKGNDIPLMGRICAVCDVFDALTSKRPYKRAWKVSEAAEELRKMSGTQFDPKLVLAFLTILPTIEWIRWEHDGGTREEFEQAA